MSDREDIKFDPVGDPPVKILSWSRETLARAGGLAQAKKCPDHCGPMLDGVSWGMCNDGATRIADGSSPDGASVLSFDGQGLDKCAMSGSGGRETTSDVRRQLETICRVYDGHAE